MNRFSSVWVVVSIVQVCGISSYKWNDDVVEAVGLLLASASDIERGDRPAPATDHKGPEIVSAGKDDDRSTGQSYISLVML